MLCAQRAACTTRAPRLQLSGAVGGPIVKDVLGFRASAYFRRDGGYIDRTDYQTGNATEYNANYADTLALRGALAWHVGAEVTVTPSIFYQHRYQNQNDRYWIADSNPDDHVFVNGTPDRQGNRDHFTLALAEDRGRLGPGHGGQQFELFQPQGDRERLFGHAVQPVACSSSC